MHEKSSPKLGDAYALETPADSARLYADWAATYDEDFAAHSDYMLPVQVAFHYKAAGGTGPVLDIGAGTGLLAEALMATGVTPIDATDISQEMLNIAQEKGVYRSHFVADVTKKLEVPNDTYAGVVSSGTFTHGHVGPDALDELIRITRPGGLLVLSINAAHFRAKGFEAKLEILSPRFRATTYHDVPIFGPDCKAEHADDKAIVAVLTKH